MANGFNINDPASDIQKYDDEMLKEFVRPNGSFDLQSFLVKPPSTKSPERLQAEQDVTMDARGDAINEIYSSQMPIASRLEEYGQPIEDSDWRAGQINMSWGRKFAKGLYRGTGNVIKGLGDAMVFAQALVSPNTLKATANKPAQWLIEKGEGMREEGEVYIPKELQDFEWSHLLNPEFWSTKVSEQLPFVFSMFVPYTSGAWLTTKGFSALARYSGVASRATKVLKGTGQVLPGSGKGVSGMFLRQLEGKGGKAIGKTFLNPKVEAITRFAGGGAFANMAEGSMLAGDAITRAIDDGMDPQLAATVGTNVFKDNLWWIGMDAIFYGIAFGGLGRKALKGITGQTRTLQAGMKVLPEERVISFGERARNMIGKGVLFGGIEGTIEQFQETYQDWIVMYNTAEAKGELPRYEGYWDYFTSEEAMETRGVSFATGFLMGGATNTVNETAERQRILDNKEKLLQYHINQSDQEGFIQQRTLINDVLKEAVEHGSPQYTRTVLNDMKADGRINEEEHKVYNEILDNYEQTWDNVEVQDKLTPSGHRILFNLNVKLADLKEDSKAADEKLKLDTDQINQNIKNKKAREDAINKLQETRDQKVNLINEQIAELESKKEDLILQAVSPEAVKSKYGYEDVTVEGAKKKQPKEQIKTFAERAAETVAGVAAKVKQTVTGEQKEQEVTEEKQEPTEKEKQKVTPENERLKSLEETLNKKQKETVALMREKGTSKESIDSYIKNKAKENAKGNKLTQKYKAEDILANPQNYSEALVVNAWRHLRGKGGPVDSGGAEQNTKSLLEEIKKDIVEGVSMDSAKYEKAGRRGIREAYEAVQDLLGKGKEEVKKKVETKEEVKETPAEKASRLAKKVKVKAKKVAKKVAKTVKEKTKNIKKKLSDTSDLLPEDEGPQRFSKAKNPDKSKIKQEDDLTQENVDEYVKEEVENETADNPSTNKYDLKSDLHYNYAAVQLMKQGFKKRFPNANVVIVDRLVTEHGVEALGRAIGSTAFIRYVAGRPDIMQSKMIHEAAHIWYELNNESKEVKDLMGMLYNTPLYKTVLKQYPELVLYRVVKRGRPKYITADAILSSLVQMPDQEIKDNFTKDVSDVILKVKKALDLSVDKQKSKVVIEDLVTEAMDVLEKQNLVKAAPREQQHHINEEVFVQHLESAGTEKFGFNFEEVGRENKVKKSEGLIKRFYARAARMIGKEDAEKISKTQVSNSEAMTMEQLENAVFAKFNTIGEDTPITNTGSKYSKSNNRMTQGKRRELVNKATDSGQVISYLKNKKNIKRSNFQKEVDKVLEIMYQSTVKNLYADLSNGKTVKLNNKEYILKGGRGLHNSLVKAAEALVSKKLDPNEKKITRYIFGKKIEKYEGEFSLAKELDTMLREAEYELEENEVIQGSLISNHPYKSYETAEEEHYDENYEGLGFLGKKDGDVLSETGSQIMDAWKENGWKPSRRLRKNGLRAKLLEIAMRSETKEEFVVNLYEEAKRAPAKFDGRDNNSHLKDFIDYLENNFQQESSGILADMFMDFQDLHYDDSSKVGIITGDNTTGKNFLFQSVADSSEYAIINHKLSQLEALNELPQIKDTIKKSINRLNELSRQKETEERNTEMNKITSDLVKLLFGTDLDSEYLDYNSVLNGKYLIRGKYMSATQFLINYSQQILKKGDIVSDGKQVRDFVTQAVIYSRAKNGLVQVLNVAGKRTRVLDYKGPARHKMDRIIERTKNKEELKKLKKEWGITSEITTEGNIFARLLADRRMPSLSYISGIYSVNYNQSAPLSQISAREFSVIQTMKFVMQWKRKTFGFYKMEISQLSNSKRQYETDGVFYNDEKMQAKLKYLKKFNSLKYKDGSYVLPYKVVLKKGKYTIEGRDGKSLKTIVNEQSKMFTNAGSMLYENPIFKGLFSISISTAIDQQHKGVKVGGRWYKKYNVKPTNEGLAMMESYILNNMINKFEAQRFFIGPHEKFNNENDLIKRGKHAFSRTRSLSSRTKIATIVVPDVYKKADDYRYVTNNKEEKQAIEDGYSLVTDSDAYHLVEDGQALEEDFGDLRKIGKMHKPQIFGTDNRSSTERNDNIKDDVFLAKVVTAPLTDDKVANDSHRDRVRQVLENLKKTVPEGTRIYAISRSGAKLGSDSRMIDISLTDEQIESRFKEIHFVEEEFRGDDPKNFGIVNELDQSTKGQDGGPRTSTHLPSQVIGHMESLSVEEETMDSKKAVNAINKALDLQEKEVLKPILGILNKKGDLTNNDLKILMNYAFNKFTNKFMQKLSTGIEDKALFVPFVQKKIAEIIANRIALARHKLRTNGTIGLSESEGMGNLAANKTITITGIQAIKFGIPKEFVGKEIIVHEIILPKWMKSQFKLNEGDVIPSVSRVPGDRKMNAQAFIIKGFHDNGGNGVQIPAEVQDIWGSDNDGDAPFVNVPYTTEKTLTERQQATNEALWRVSFLIGSLNRVDERNETMDFTEEANTATVAANNIYGAITKFKYSQLTPAGTNLAFKDNIGSGNLIGPAAISNLIQVVLRSNGVKLSTPIMINGKKISEFTNDNLDVVMGLAKMLNMKLDQPTKQLLSGLGITKNTANAAMILRGLGFSLSDIAIILRSRGAKEYDLAKGERELTAEDQGRVDPVMIARYNLMTEVEKALYHKSKKLDIRKGKIIEQRESASPELDSILKWFNNIKEGKVKEEDISIILEDLNSSDPNVKREANIKVIALLHYSDIISDIIYEYNNQTGYHKTGVVPSSVLQINEKKGNLDKILKERPVLEDEGKLNKSPKLIHANKTLDSVNNALSKVSLAGTKSAKAFFSQFKKLTGSSISMNRLNEYNGLIQKYIAKKIEKIVPLFGGTYKNLKGEEVNIEETKAKLQKFLLTHSKRESKFSPFLDLITFDITRGGLTFKAKTTKNLVDSQRAEIEKAFSSMPLEIQKAFVQLDFFANGFQSSSIISLIPKFWFTNQYNNGIDDIMTDVFLTETNEGSIDKLNDKIAEEIIIENPHLLNNFFEGDFMGADNNIRFINPKKTGNKEINEAIADNKPHYIKVSQKKDTEYIHSVFKHLGDGVYQRISGAVEIKDAPVKQVKKGTSSQVLKDIVDRKNRSNKGPIDKYSKKGPVDPDEQNNHHQDSQEISRMSEEEYARSIGYNYEQIRQPENADLYKYLRERYRTYLNELEVARDFKKSEVDTGRIKNKRIWSSERLATEFQRYLRLDSQAAKPAMDAIALELALRAGKEQNDVINKNPNYNWKRNDDLGAIQAWLISNNIPSKRPEIQRLVRLMEQEYRKFVKEYTAEKRNLQKVHKSLVDEKLKNKSYIESLKLRMSPKAWNEYIFGNIYIEDKYTDSDGVVRTNLRLKTQDEFNASSPTKAERAYYEYYKKTTNRFFARYANVEGVNYAENYIPHVGMGNLETFSSTGLYGVWSNITGSATDLDHIKVRGTIVVNGKVQEKILSLGKWKDIYLAGPVTLPGGKKIFELEKLKKRAEQLKKEGKHDDGTIINMTAREAGELNNDGVFTRFVKGRPTDAANFATRNLTQALDTYMKASIFVYGSNEFMGFKTMLPLVDGIISLNKKLGNVNAAKYVEKVWKEGFLKGKKQVWISKEVDAVVDTFVKWALYVYLGASIAAAAVNVIMGKYNTIRSQGWRQFAKGEKRFWSPKTFWKTHNILKQQYQWEDQVYDVVDFNAKSMFDTIIFAPLNYSERWVQGVSFVGMMSEAEYNAYDDNGNIIDQSNALSEEEIIKRTDKIRRNQGRGYTRIDQRVLSMYSFGRAILQFKRWLPTMAVERFGKEDINRFGEKEVGSWRQFGNFSYNIVRRLALGQISLKTFKEEYNKMPKQQQSAVNVALRGFGLLLVLAGIGLATDDDESATGKKTNKIAKRTLTDATIFFRPSGYQFNMTPASFNIVQGSINTVDAFVTGRTAQSSTRFRDKGEAYWKGEARKLVPLQRAIYSQ